MSGPLSPVSIQTHASHATQELALRALRKRKPQALDWLLRSTIPIGWRLRSLREKSYAMFLLA